MTLEPGEYVVAVSGGVDSVALLDVLFSQFGQDVQYEFVVAHFDHGIRSDSMEDRRLVERLAKGYDMPFEYREGRLGASVSEAAARRARYAFLREIQQRYQADAIITAHHQDDVLETALINLLRGTGRRGVTSLKSEDGLIRPLLDLPKQQLMDYAQQHGLEWREDSTNTDIRYFRNYVRHNIVSRMSKVKRAQLLTIITELRARNQEIDDLLANALEVMSVGDGLDRHAFIMLPHTVAREVMAAWLRQNGIREYDKKTLERLVIAAKTYKTDKKTDIDSTIVLLIRGDTLALTGKER